MSAKMYSSLCAQLVGVAMPPVLWTAMETEQDWVATCRQARDCPRPFFPPGLREAVSGGGGVPLVAEGRPAAECTVRESGAGSTGRMGVVDRVCLVAFVFLAFLIRGSTGVRVSVSEEGRFGAVLTSLRRGAVVPVPSLGEVVARREGMSPAVASADCGEGRAAASSVCLGLLVVLFGAAGVRAGWDLCDHIGVGNVESW